MAEIRYYNNNQGPTKENEMLALKKALEICNEKGNIEEIVLLIHTKNNTGYIERIFETRNVKKFFNGVKIDANYPPLRIETIRTFNDDYQSKKILVAFGLRSEELYKYDDFESIVAIIAHQWVEPDVQDWAKTWGAIDLSTNEPIAKIDLPSQVVQNAFTNLSNSINMSSGITNPFDNDRCKTYIRALKKYDYEMNSQEIFSFLTTQLNWDSDNAKDVIKLIDKVNTGSYFKGGSKTGLQNHIKRWKSK